MICTDACSNYCAIVPIKGKSESNLALGLIACINKMSGNPKVIMTDGEGAIKNSGLFHKYFTEHQITYVSSRGRHVFAERMIRTFQGDVRQTNQDRPTVEWFDIPSITDL